LRKGRKGVTILRKWSFPSRIKRENYQVPKEKESIFHPRRCSLLRRRKTATRPFNTNGVPRGNLLPGTKRGQGAFEKKKRSMAFHKGGRGIQQTR